MEQQEGEGAATEVLPLPSCEAAAGLEGQRAALEESGLPLPSPAVAVHHFPVCPAAGEEEAVPGGLGPCCCEEQEGQDPQQAADPAHGRAEGSGGEGSCQPGRSSAEAPGGAAAAAQNGGVCEEEPAEQCSLLSQLGGLSCQ